MAGSARDRRAPRGVAFKRRIAAALRSRGPAAAVNRLTKGVITSEGLVIDTNSPSVANTTRAALFWGFYESAERRLIRRHPPTSEVLVDLGASLGVVSAAAAKHLPPHGRIICIEANPALVALTERNVTRNAPHVTVEVIHGAVDYESTPGQQVTFASAAQHVASKLSRTAGVDTGFSAPVVRLRDVVPSDQPFDLLCDIEGAEVGLLREEADVLGRCRQLFIEAHVTDYGGDHYDVDDIQKLIIEHGFVKVDEYGNSSVWARPA